VNVQAAARQFACAQIFLGYARPQANVQVSVAENAPTPSEVEQLNTQIEQIMAQMAAVQKAISAQEQRHAIASPTKAVSQ
jgi:hypothetical protein